MAAGSSFYLLFQCYVIVQCNVKNINFQLIDETLQRKQLHFSSEIMILTPSESSVHIKSVCGNRRKECHQFWLRLCHAVILISNDRTSASKKINGMTLIRTLTVSTTAFERTKEKFYGFRQTKIFYVPCFLHI